MMTIHVAIPLQPYTVTIHASAIARIADHLRLFNNPQLALIADKTVIGLHGTSIQNALAPYNYSLLEIEPGEASKSLTNAARLYDALARTRFERSDVILALGGGVVGDLAGFVAATWMRGVRWIQVPTTLEAAIDASVGGKTAVNHALGKNLIGAFHQPSAVIIDTDFLSTLSDRDFRAGLAESIKHAVMRDAGFFDWQMANTAKILKRDPAVLEELIARNVTIKAWIVAADEREAGLRAILNYGHTIGHAIEHLCEFQLRHGECVALGMIVENELALRRGILPAPMASAIRALIDTFGLPMKLPCKLEAAKVCDAIRGDKKTRSGVANYALAAGLAAPVQVHDITDGEVASALESIHP